jgi:hypothetical protein
MKNEANTHNNKRLIIKLSDGKEKTGAWKERRKKTETGSRECPSMHDELPTR